MQSLKVEATSGPLHGKEGFYTVRVEARRAGRQLSAAEARPEIKRRLLCPKQEQALQAWLAEQEKRSKIEVLL